MSTEDTARVARAYFDAWSNRRGPDALRPLLAEDFVFDAGPVHIEGREAFLGAAEWPARARTTLEAEAYDGEHGFQLYAAVNGMARIRSAEHLVVRDGAIAASEIVGDLAAFQAFMAASSPI
jgi:ketosteroid isomerase-like protein